MNDESNKIASAYTAEHKKLKSFIRARTKTYRSFSAEDAEDILQDVALSALSGIDVFAPLKNAAAYLFSSARNRIVDSYRKQTVQQKNVDANFDSEFFSELIDLKTVGVMDEYERQEILTALEEAIDELPKDQRYIIVKQALEGETFQVLSEKTGLSIDTLMSRKRYAILNLRASLRDFI